MFFAIHNKASFKHISKLETAMSVADKLEAMRGNLQARREASLANFNTYKANALALESVAQNITPIALDAVAPSNADALTASITPELIASLKQQVIG